MTGALVTPLLNGSSVVCLPESDIRGALLALDGYQLTWLTAGFTVHREILRCAPEFPETVAANRVRCIRVGSGRLEQEEIDRIEQTFHAPVLRAYGMTEATPIAHDTLTSRPHKPDSRGQPTQAQVAIFSEAEGLCPTGTSGEIVIRGPLVFDGYFDDAQANASAFVDGWFHTGDLGSFDDVGHLHVVGRIKDLINRGGEKISPAALDAIIEAILGVRAAASFGVPHRSLGEELAAAVVRDGEAAIQAADIIDHVRRRMGPRRVPRRIYFVDRLPRTDSGKVCRSELRHMLGLEQAEAPASRASSAETATRPLSALETALVGVWSAVLPVGRINASDDFFLLGGDSLMGARLLSSVKAVFEVEVTLESLFNECSTIAGMARAIEAVRSGEADQS